MKTLSNGTTIETKATVQGLLIILDNPDAPDDMRHLEAGRIVTGGAFQPAPFSAAALRPEALRAIADMIEERP